MYIWGRLIAHAIAGRGQPRLDAPFGVSVLPLRVWPADCDPNLHVNNGRYGMLADLGRYDLFVRTGIWRGLRKAGLAPIMGGGAISFAKEIRLWRKFELHSRILTWQATRLICEQRFVLPAASGGGAVETAVFFLSSSGFYDSRARRFETVDSVFQRIGILSEPPAIDPTVADFLVGQEDMRKAVKEARV
jgi:acyl-CoA thioesterase FadM